MKKLYTIIIFINCQLSIINCTAQAPYIQWEHCFGGLWDDQANSVQQTADGGYIIAGYTESDDGDVTFNNGPSSSRDFWIIKLDASGILQWQVSLGGSLSENAYSIRQTADGGYVVAGEEDSDDGDITMSNPEPTNFWLVKLTSTGGIQWQKTYGGSKGEEAYSMEITSDGGYVLAGWSLSYDEDLTMHHGDTLLDDYWVVKLDTGGTIQWQKSLGGNFDDVATSVKQTIDGGYIVAGYSASNDGDVSGHHGADSSSYDYWVVRLDSAGSIQWQKSLGGTARDQANSIIQTFDGGYLVAGYTQSNDGDVTGNHGNKDYWLVKLNAFGTIQWQKTYGGTGIETAYAVQQCADSSYIIAGNSSSNNGDVSGNHGAYDFWLINLDASGVINWQKCLGGSGAEFAYSIQQTNDNGYIVAGYSTSHNNGDVTGYHLNGSFGTSDYWIVKLAPCTSTSTLTQTVCDSLSLNGTTYSTSGTYIQTLTNFRSCDSTLSINLTVNHTSVNSISPVACSSYSLNSQSYTTSGVYTQALTTAGGCDSTLTINLTINTVDTSVTAAGNILTANSSGTYQWLDCNAGYSVIAGATSGVYTATTNGDYALQITANGCVDTSNCYSVYTVGLDETENNNVQMVIEPNPATTELRIINYELGIKEVRIYNLLGECIQQLTTNNQQLTTNNQQLTLDISKLNSGLYFLQVQSGEKVVSRKFVKE